MLVIEEVRWMSSSGEGLGQLERMVRRDRSRACVMLWSLGNEEPHMASERGARIVRSMKRLANRLDPSRLCTFAMDKGFGQGVWNVVDVVGFNYRINQMDEFHARFPDKPLLGSETGSTVATRGAYARDDEKGHVRAYDRDHPWWASTAESWWSHVAARPWIAGGFVWTGFDYRGEPTPYNRWPNVASQFGILTAAASPRTTTGTTAPSGRASRAAPVPALELAGRRSSWTFGATPTSTASSCSSTA
jgi:beta-galactosidase